MNIIQQPDDLCFSGNLKDLILSGVTGNIPFKLLVDDKVIVDEIYSPVSGMVRVNFKDVIDEYLSITVPGDEGLLEQTGGLKRFSMQVGLSIVNFTVIKGGINDQPSSGDFLRGRWLTRQPAVKETSEEQPEWLSCYVSEPLLVKIKGYLPGGSEERKLHDLQPGKLYTVNTSLGIVRDLLGSSVNCYDAWLENPAGARFSNVQRYRVVDRTPGARVYVFENTTGGIDTIAFTGKHGEKVTTEGTITTLENVTLDRAMDFSLVLSQNTGFIPSLDHARWLKGFLVSKQRYHVTRFGLKRIYLRESENDFTCNNLNSYTFEFQYSLQDIYDSYWEPEDLPPVDDPVDGFSITVGYHPADGSRGTTEPSGTVTLQPGEDLLVRMLPAGGCQVERFNVDQEEQPLANLYTFNNVREDHTMFVWFKQGDEPGEVYTDFLERSDQPGVYYSSVHSALDAIKSSYPGGLTRNVTLSCVKKARDRRDAGDPLKANNERIFLSVLKRWNRDSMYTLTLDGAGLLTCDCASLGGLRFDRVDNVVIKNTTFVNYANFVEGSTPEEVAAVMVIGADGTPARNFFIKNCVFNGISIANKTTCSTYTMSCKYIENLTVVGSRFSNNAGITFKLTNAVMSSFVKNVISGVKRTGAVGHPGFFSVTNGRVLMIEDNDMDGSTFNESLVYVSGIDNVTISRNHVHEGARVAEFSANTGIDNITIESNLIVNVLMTPVFPWIQECFSTSCDVDKFVFRGNTLWMGGNNYMQFVCRFNQTDTREAEICNNIIVDPSSSQTSGVVSGFLFKTLGSLRSRNNIFKFSVRNEETLQSYSSFIGVDNPDNSPGSLTVTGGNRYKLSYLVSAGLDSGSALVNKSVKLLDVENGGNSYAITPTSNNSYPPSESDVARFDRDYKLKAVAGNSRGCYNLAGSVVDEGVDATTGYTGQNLTEPGNFDSETRYDNVADCVLLLKHDTIDRERPVKFSVTGTQHRILALGRFAVIHAYPELDVNGEYQADELYTINVD